MRAVKGVLVSGVALTMAVAVAACGSSSTSGGGESTGAATSQAAELTTVGMGTQPWIGYGPWEIAKAQGFDKAHGIDLQLSTFTTDADVTSAFASNKIVATNAASITVGRLLDKYPDQAIVLVEDISTSADAIIAGPSVASVADLKGKKVAYEEGSTSDLLLRYALGTAGLTMEDITAVPTLERIKLGTNRVKINPDGTSEFFGKSQVQRTFWSGTGQSLSSPSGGVNAPNDFDVTVSRNVSYRQQLSSFPNGSDTRSAGTMIPVPRGLDTSRTVTCRIAFTTDGVDANAVQWDLYVAPVSIGDVIGALTEVLHSNTSTPTGATVAGQVWEVEFPVDVQHLANGDFIAFSLWRKGATDTNTDTANLLTVAWSGFFWL